VLAAPPLELELLELELLELAPPELELLAPPLQLAWMSLSSSPSWHEAGSLVATADSQVCLRFGSVQLEHLAARLSQRALAPPDDVLPDDVAPDDVLPDEVPPSGVGDDETEQAASESTARSDDRNGTDRRMGKPPGVEQVRAGWVPHAART